MDVSEDITATLRAQDHGHPPVVCMAFDVYNTQGNDKVFKTLNHIATDSDHIPVVCFEPGILRRDCSAGNRAYIDICSTLRAQMGDNQPAVCYSVDCRNLETNKELSGTLQTKETGGWSLNYLNPVMYENGKRND